MANRQRSRLEQRKALLFVSVMVGLGLVFAIVVGDRGVRRLAALRQTLTERSHDAYRRIVRNRELAEEIAALETDDRLLEEMARRRLGVVGRDEVVVVFPGDDEQER